MKLLGLHKPSKRYHINMPRKSKEDRATYMREYRKRIVPKSNGLEADRLQFLQTVRAVIADARRGNQTADILARYEITTDELKEILQLARDLRS